MSWEMIARCMRAQPPLKVTQIDYQVVDALPHPYHEERTIGTTWTPNLVVWTGLEHRLAIELKEDTDA